jgi:hypothetical protein
LKLTAAGAEIRADERLAGFHRVYVNDPFGNRIELMEPTQLPEIYLDHSPRDDDPV